MGSHTSHHCVSRPRSKSLTYLLWHGLGSSCSSSKLESLLSDGELIRSEAVESWLPSHSLLMGTPACTEEVLSMYIQKQNVRKICNAISEDIETPLNESSVVKPIQKLTRITYLREIHNAEDEAKWISRMDHLISFVQHDRRTKSELSTSKGAEG